MSCPRIEIDLNKIRHNARSLVERLGRKGISVTGVTKAVCGHPEVAQAMLDGGVAGLADARVENVERLRQAGITAQISLIRTPMLSQVDRVVRSCSSSYNTELAVIEQLSGAACLANRVHDVILMVEMGDLREGILPADLIDVARKVSKMPGVALRGIGANFACLHAQAPDAEVMAAFSRLAVETDEACGLLFETVSGGNSANLPWAFGSARPERINNLRLGEAILLGVEPLSGLPISGLETDAFRLVTEVIETKAKASDLVWPATKPGLPLVGQSQPTTTTMRSILAIGLQDTDLAKVTLPADMTVIGASSDHFVIETLGQGLPVGSEVSLQMTYSALMRAMNAPQVSKVVHNPSAASRPLPRNRNNSGLVLV